MIQSSHHMLCGLVVQVDEARLHRRQELKALQQASGK